MENVFMDKDSGRYTISVFLDLAQALNIVKHQIQLCKLQNYGLHGILREWFLQYLENLKQYASIGGALSSLKDIVCGVAHRSILPRSTSFNLTLFVDEATLQRDYCSMLLLYHKVNEELVIVSNWFKNNKLTLNSKNFANR
jgi:hypothetical protein